MFCSKCGKEVAANAAFCAGCGTQINLEQSASDPAKEAQPTVPTSSSPIKGKTKKCQKCSMDIPVSAMKCPHCTSTQFNPKGCGIGCLIIIVLSIIFGIAEKCGCISSSMPKPKINVTTPVEISAEQYGVQWPLSVKSGKVYRIDYAAVFSTYDTADKKLKLYALNESARDKGYPDISEIQIEDINCPGRKQDASFLLDLANNPEEFNKKNNNNKPKEAATVDLSGGVDINIASSEIKGLSARCITNPRTKQRVAVFVIGKDKDNFVMAGIPVDLLKDGLDYDSDHNGKLLAWTGQWNGKKYHVALNYKSVTRIKVLQMNPDRQEMVVNIYGKLFEPSFSNKFTFLNIPPTNVTISGDAYRAIFGEK